MNNSEYKELPLVSIVTINFNSTKVTYELIDSLKKISYPRIEIIVVDNASKDSPDILKEIFPEIILIKNKINKGFAGGNNDGFRVARGEYIFMLNNDIEVTENFLEPLVAIMESDKTIGSLSPKICYHQQPDTIQFAGGDGINIYTGRGKFSGHKQKDIGQYDNCREIAHGHGAAMLLSRKAIERTGMICEDYFLYYEELDYCERLKKAGFKIWYAGTSVVYHKESMSVGKDNPLKVFYQTRNRLLYLKRNINGLPLLTSKLFFFTFSLPKNLFSFLMKGKTKLLNAYLKGVSAYLQLK